MTDDQSEPRLRRRDAARFLHNLGYPVASSTLAKLACIGGGPDYELYGRLPLYTKSGLMAWVKSRTRPPRRRAVLSALREK